MPRRSPKIAKDRPKIPPKGFKETPKSRNCDRGRAKTTLKTTQELPKLPPRCPEDGRSWPENPPRAETATGVPPKRPPRQPRNPPNCHQAPKMAEGAPRNPPKSRNCDRGPSKTTLQDRPNMAQKTPKMTQEIPKSRNCDRGRSKTTPERFPR